MNEWANINSLINSVLRCKLHFFKNTHFEDVQDEAEDEEKENIHDIHVDIGRFIGIYYIYIKS